MARTMPSRLAPEWEPQYTRMIGVSAGLHVAAFALILLLAAQVGPRPVPPQAYTVELLDPRALGGRLPPGPLDRPMGATKSGGEGGSLRRAARTEHERAPRRSYPLHAVWMTTGAT